MNRIWDISMPKNFSKMMNDTNPLNKKTQQILNVTISKKYISSRNGVKLYNLRRS